MRTIPIGLAPDYAAPTQTLAQFLLLIRQDGLRVGLTAWDSDVTFPSGITIAGQDASGIYLANPGITPTAMVWTSGLNVDNGEARFLENDTYINKNDVLAKKWSKAAFYLFQANPLNPAAGVDVWMVGNMGDVKIDEGGFVAELRSVLQLLQVTIGKVTSKTCTTYLFSPQCKVDEPSNTFTGTVTTAGRQVLVDTARIGMPDDWFGDGLFEFTSGDANGIQVKVREFDGATGTFTFVMPVLLMPAIGDTYVAKTGCRKRAYEDCRDKFDNIFNFEGQPHLPGNDYITSPGDVSNDA